MYITFGTLYTVVYIPIISLEIPRNATNAPVLARFEFSRSKKLYKCHPRCRNETDSKVGIDRKKEAVVSSFSSSLNAQGCVA